METKNTREELLARIETFLKQSGMSEREFGIKAANNHKFVNRLRKGFGVTLTGIEKAEAFIDAYDSEAAA